MVVELPDCKKLASLSLGSSVLEEVSASETFLLKLLPVVVVELPDVEKLASFSRGIYEI